MTSTEIDVNALRDELDAQTLEALPRDVSPREYFRGRDRDGRDFILMVYPDSSPEHVAELKNFIAIGQWLADQGIKTPELYHFNQKRCYALFEDLGAVSFGKWLRRSPEEQAAIYTLATDVLKTLKGAGVPDGLPAYGDSRIHENRIQIIQYYLPLLAPRTLEDVEHLTTGYLAAWDEVEKSLPACPQGFVHGDYHLENLMYRPAANGLQKCALIDYQDALHGPLPYDLVNLLEDARVDVPRTLRKAMIARYCDGMSAEETSAFLAWYRVLGTQFHCRVIGLFIKLAAEQGRDQYLVHIPRLQQYITDALSDPILAPLKTWFEKEGVDFSPIKDLHGDHIRTVFRG